MPRDYDVITIGETTIDAFMKIHDTNRKIHLDATSGEVKFRLGDKINVEKYEFCLGGNATNVAVGLTRLGLKTTLCTEIGDDEFSIKIRNNLARENIERLFVKQTKNAPSNFSVILSFKDDRTIFVEDVVREHDFKLDEANAKYIYLTSLGKEWEGTYRMSLKFAIDKNCKIAFNPGHLQLADDLEIVHKVLQKSEILFLNKEEGEMILLNHYKRKIDNSEHYIKNLCEELQKLGPHIVVVTNGKHGSSALDASGKFYTQDLYPGKVVERTGAGDAYGSGFLAAIIHGFNMEAAMKWGAINAASVVGQVGAEAGLLTKSQMDESYKS